MTLRSLTQRTPGIARPRLGDFVLWVRGFDPATAWYPQGLTFADEAEALEKCVERQGWSETHRTRLRYAVWPAGARPNA